MATMQWIAINALKPNPRNARTHSNKQIHQIADSIAAFGFLVPILIDESCASDLVRPVWVFVQAPRQ